MKRYFLFFSISLFILSSCRKADESGGSSLNLLPLTQDVAMGLESVRQIESNPTEYPILDSAKNVAAYAHIERITNTILNSGKIAYRTQFTWKVKLINKNVLNAFCTPGGYIYVYTGLIKYLNDEASLAGVMGHEIAHADNRHSSSQMLNQYGLGVLLQILSGGDNNTLTKMGASLIGLKNSRDHETEADKFSVIFLYPTDYDAEGAKYFFEKLLAEGTTSSKAEEFFSTHPNPDNRVANITAVATTQGTKKGEKFIDRYAQFKALLP